MNVLYIVGGEGNRYGSEIIAIDLLSAGKENGINYTVVTANKGAVSDACNQLGIENYVIPFRFFVYKAMRNPLLELIKKTVWRSRAEYLTNRAKKNIAKKVNMQSIDVIHTNLSRDLLGGMLSEQYHIPHVWHIHELYKSHYGLSFLRKNQVEWMGGHADRFIAISQIVADEWVKSGLPADKVSVIYNGIDFSRIAQKETLHDTDPLKLVMVGHLVSEKGQAQVIEKLSRLPEEIRRHVTFDCVGEGTEEYKQLLLTLAKKHDIAVTLRGYCADVGSILKEYDIGINHSRGEGFGLATVEYMAAGLCPVAANTGANTEIIRDRSNGFIFDYEDENSLPDLIMHLYCHRDEMRNAARWAMRDSRSRFTLENMCRQVFALYKELAKAQQTE